MKTSKPPTSSRKLAAAVQTARHRFAKAESAMESAAKDASVTKRKRKEAREAARLAKKELKRAKHGMAEAKRELRNAEKKLAKADGNTSKTAIDGASPQIAVPATAKKRVLKAARRRVRRRPAADGGTAELGSTENSASPIIEGDAMPPAGSSGEGGEVHHGE